MKDEVALSTTIIEKTYYTSEQCIQDVIPNIGESVKWPNASVMDAVAADATMYDTQELRDLKYYRVEIRVTEIPLETQV